MPSKKRLFLTFAALGLAVGSAYGCGGDDTSSRDGSPASNDGGSIGGDAGGGDAGSDDAPLRVVAATGQTECFDVNGNTINCAGTGQDGEFQAGVAHPTPRFTDNGDGTVRDNLTGLIWLQRADCLGQTDWQEALSRSNSLASGHNGCQLFDGSVTGDWRLPNIRELMSLLSVSQGYPALPAGHPFIDVRNQMHWTSTSRADGEDSAWTGSPFASGRYDTGDKANDDWWVWPVRGNSLTANAPMKVAATHQTDCFDNDGNTIDCVGTGQDGEIRAGVPLPAQRFTDPGDGTVVDNLTGLVWLKQADCLDSLSYADAFAETMALASGHEDCQLSDGSVAGDWRVPNHNEFLSVLDVSRYAPQLTDGHPFEGILNGLHWTSTTLSAGPDSSWKINPFWRNIHGGSKNNSHYTWAVRDAR